ncbi:hypothetical protein BD410DRAFT_267184 [Rickenella mellea]|uniref:Uncharacterized protein n=1 Tax=Rickenella mellea TaxID=50990 RepID=A0A4Y7Q4J2_9AGAM|nr:hypothetical protein BD410DRAFT_267184 [Rickenella mellea]
MDLPLSAMRQLTITSPETSDRHLPNELVANILCDVLGSSIHHLCTENPKSGNMNDLCWDVRIALTLSAVCFTFREMTRQIILKLFGIQPDALDWTDSVQGKLILLRDLALSATRSFGDPAYPPSSNVMMQLKRSEPRNPFLCAYYSAPRM